MPLKVVFVAPYMTIMLRGIERCVYEIGTRLASRGHEVHILYWPGSRSWPYGSTPGTLYLHRLPISRRYYQSYTAGLLYPLYFYAIRPDIVNFFYSWQGEEIAHLLWRDPRPASVLHLQYPAQEVPVRYAQLSSSRVLRRAQTVVACSDYVAGGVQVLLKHNPVIIRNGVDVDRFSVGDVATKSRIRKQLGLPGEWPIFCTVAALEERKGIGRALEAMALMHAQSMDFHYVVVGEGPLRPQLEQYIATHNLGPKVSLVGAHADPRPYYQVADVFLFLSRGEASPLAPLEAMSTALPIVAAQQPPLDELLPREGTIFVDETSPTDVCNALFKLTEDASLRQTMGAFNRMYAAEKYSWDTVVDRYEALYRDVTSSAAS